MVDDFEFKVRSLKSKICLVTGATGVIGVPLVHELLANNHIVRVLARGDISINLFPASVEIVRGDLSEVAALDKAATDADWIFHLAAKLHVKNPQADLQREYHETNVVGTEKLIAAAVKHKIEKFVFFSTINVYGASDGQNVFDETSEIAPQGFYAESKAAAEKIVLAQDFGVVLRLAAIYGSRMKGNYVRLLEALRRNRFMFVGEGRNRRTLIHQQDAARAAILAAERAVPHSIYNVTDGGVHTFSVIITAMSEALGKNSPKIHLPFLPINLGIGLVEDVGRIFHIKSPVNRALLEKLIEDVAVSGSKLRDELGFQPQFDLKIGWRETISAVNSQQSAVNR